MIMDSNEYVLKLPKRQILSFTFKFATDIIEIYDIAHRVAKSFNELIDKKYLRINFLNIKMISFEKKQ